MLNDLCKKNLGKKTSKCLCGLYHFYKPVLTIIYERTDDIF